MSIEMILLASPGPGFLALCVSAMMFVMTDLSLKLVEWLEVLRLQGYEKVFIYVYSVHPNVERVRENRIKFNLTFLLAHFFAKKYLLALYED